MRESLVVTALLLLMAHEASAQERPPIPAALTGPPPLITFEDAVHRAMTRNPNVELAQQDVARAQGLLEQVRSTWYPTLSANGTYTRLDSDRVLSGRVITGVDSLNANLLLTVPILAPKNWVATARAKDNREIAKATVVDTRRQVALVAGRAYLTVIAQRLVLETSVQARDTAKAHEDFARSRLAGGVGNRLDAVRASQERASAETQVQIQILALARAQEALGVLLGDNGPVDAGDVSLAPPPTLADAMSEVQRRSDVVVDKERADYARKSVRDSYTDYLPILTGLVQPFYQNPATLTLPATGWQAQLLLTIPLYDGGYRYGLKHERDALYDQGKTKVEAVLRQARSEVRIGFEAVQRSDDSLLSARDAAKLAQEALDLSQLAYRAGATSNLEVIDAERRARDAATAAAVAEDTARQARLDLLAAAGKFP